MNNTVIGLTVSCRCQTDSALVRPDSHFRVVLGNMFRLRYTRAGPGDGSFRGRGNFFDDQMPGQKHVSASNVALATECETLGLYGKKKTHRTLIFYFPGNPAIYGGELHLVMSDRFAKKF